MTSKENERPAEDASAKRDKRNSLERLADFTKRIIAVPKAEIEAQKRREKHKKKGG